MARLFLIYSIESLFLVSEQIAFAQTDKTKSKENTWRTLSKYILNILHAPKRPKNSIYPDKKHMILTNPIVFLIISELSQPMLKKVGIHINPKSYYSKELGVTSLRILTIKNGKTIPLNIPKKRDVHSIYWTPEGKYPALSVRFKNRSELDGNIERIPNIILNPLMNNPVKWFPNKKIF